MDALTRSLRPFDLVSGRLGGVRQPRRAPAGHAPAQPTGPGGAVDADDGEAAAVAQEGTLPSGAEDARLVTAARAGDPVAFDRLVRRHLAGAHRVALRVLDNTHDAEDVCQDAFVQALVHLESCDPERFGAWLLTIVRNRAYNLIKSRRVRAAEPLEGAAQKASSGDDPSHAAYRGEVRGRIDEALKDLTELQRGVVEMFDGEGWTHREIAERLGISEGSSRVHLHAARAKLRLRLGDLSPFGGQSERDG